MGEKKKHVFTETATADKMFEWEKTPAPKRITIAFSGMLVLLSRCRRASERKDGLVIRNEPFMKAAYSLIKAL